MSDVLIAIVLGVVEGVTEFLPISSTGHLILCQKWFGIDLENDPFWKMFAIFIQIGAIAAVVVYFRERIRDLLSGRRSIEPAPGEPSPPAHIVSSAPLEPNGSGVQTAVLEQKAIAVQPGVALHRNPAVWLIGVGSLPLSIAYFAHRWADRNLESAVVVAAALGIGGVLMILIEAFRPRSTTHRIEAMSWRQALGIGMAQIIAALFPGTSRSAATIMGGELAGLSRSAAAEFSFFLAIPAMSAACLFSLLKHRTSLDLHHIMLLAIGTVVSFFVAWAVIAAFMNYIRRHSFVPFAIYRIGLSMVVLLAIR